MFKRSWRTLPVALATAGALLAATAISALADQGGTGLQPTIPNGDSPNGHNLYNLYLLISIPALVIFVLVEALLLTIIVRFRRSKRPAGFIPPQWHGNTKLEVIWTVIPAVLIFGIGALSFAELQQDFTKRTDAETQKNVTIQAYRYGWEYTYEEDHLKFTSDAQAAADHPMVVPVDTLVRIRLQSRDVIHGWWIPYLTGKTDAVPGYDNYAWIKPSKIGEYRGECTELCGPGHATMFLLVKVVSQSDFDSWVRQERVKETAPSPSPSASASPRASASPSPSPPASPAASPSPSPSPTR